MPIGPARLYHVNANCSDLHRSLAFYTERIGLTTTVRTTVEPQPCAVLGLDLGAWDAWVLSGTLPHGEGAVLDLLQWVTPGPVGRPAGPGDLGYTTLVFESPTVPPGPAVDPDGTLLEIRAGERPRFAAVTLGVRDVNRSAEWWSDVVGVQATDGVLADDRGTSAFAVELVGVPDPGTAAPPSSTANRLGLYRMALLTGSIVDDHRFLVDRGVTCLSGVERLDMGQGLPTLQVLCFLDPDGTVVELIESPA
jgi:catechol 2,3-dioxygenase-like lactoylglutathione lyase family enzyme